MGEGVREIVKKIRCAAADMPEIPIALYNEAHRIEMYQEADGRSMDELENLRYSCLETAERIQTILKMMGEQLNGGSR